MAAIRNEFRTNVIVKTSDEGLPDFSKVGACRLLREYKADPNAVKDKTGRAAIHYAARHGNIDMINALIECNADVFSLDRSNATPVHRALMHRHSKAAIVLLQKMCSDLKIEREDIESISSKTPIMSPDGDVVDKDDKSWSDDDRAFMTAYDKKKRFLQRTLAGKRVGRIASLGSAAKSRFQYLLQWFQERKDYFSELCHEPIEKMLSEVIEYIEESLPTINTEFQMSVHNVFGANAVSEKQGNYYVRAIVPGCSTQQTDIHWNCSNKMPEFNWRLKFRIVLSPRSLCW